MTPTRKARLLGAITQAALERDVHSLHYSPDCENPGFIPGRDYGKKMDRKENSAFIKKKLYILIKEDN